MKLLKIIFLLFFHRALVHQTLQQGFWRELVEALLGHQQKKIQKIKGKQKCSIEKKNVCTEGAFKISIPQVMMAQIKYIIQARALKRGALSPGLFAGLFTGNSPEWALAFFFSFMDDRLLGP